MIEQITGQNNKLTKARELLLNEEIESADYRLIKSETESKIRVLEARISEMKTDFVSLSEVEKTLDRAIEVLTAIDVIYCKSDSSIQRKIIGSMYPEKFTFEDLQHRTAKVNDSFQIIYLINSKLQGKKNGTNDRFFHLSH